MKTEKLNFHCYKSPTFSEAGIDSVLVVSNKIFFGKKTLNTLLLPKTRVCVKSYDVQSKLMCFLIEDEDLLDKHNNTWDKVSANIKREFNREPVYYNIFLKTKVKSYGDEATDFPDKEMVKKSCNYTCLEAITIDSGLIKENNYYPQVLLKECSYTEKEKND